MSQQFCLKWNNHTTNMLSVFENLLSTEALVDVTLACDGLTLKAHKMVLSACSPFFQSLFLENPCKHPIVIMKDMRYNDLKAIIDFMYRGEVNVSHDHLSALLKTAETLKVKGLAEVTGEKASSGSGGVVQQEVTQNVSTPTSVPSTRTDSPPLQGKRKRGRPRKRSLSDSNRSDDEGVASKIKEPDSSDIEELSGDASMEATSDIRTGGGPHSSQAPVQTSSVNTFKSRVPSMSQDPLVVEPASGDENEFEVEPAKLLEQTLTADDVPSNNQNNLTFPSVSGLEVSKRTRSSTAENQALVPSSLASDSLGSNMQGPDSPQDIKPQIISFDEHSMSSVPGPSHGSDNTMMMYMDNSGVSSLPGPSTYQDNSLVQHDSSQPQGGNVDRMQCHLSWLPEISQSVMKPGPGLSSLSSDDMDLMNIGNVDGINYHLSWFPENPQSVLKPVPELSPLSLGDMDLMNICNVDGMQSHLSCLPENPQSVVKPVPELSPRTPPDNICLIDVESVYNIDYFNDRIKLVTNLPPHLENKPCKICFQNLSGNIAYSDYRVVVRLKLCSHVYHRDCLKARFDSGQKRVEYLCLICRIKYGLYSAVQPPGTMEDYVLPLSLPGYECDTICITYNFRDGTQELEHPNPREPYTAKRFPRHCYLPNNDIGRKVLRLLKKAWHRRLIFTIGYSSIDREDDTIIWNDIPHKTSFESNKDGDGYPDPNYFHVVLSRLEMFGIIDD